MTNETKVLLGVAVATIVIVISAAFMFGGSSSPDKNAQGQKISADQAKVLTRADSHKSGAKDAKVTLVEFGDFQCPACGASYPIVTQILTDYKGKITFVFRNFPLSMHQNSHISAEAVEAAGAQGKFFEMYDALYQNQKDWGEDKNPMQFFQKYAKMIGLDVDQFTNDVKADKYKNKIQQDLNDGNTLGISATPTFFLNGEKITGGLPYDQFKTKIDAALKSS